MPRLTKWIFYLDIFFLVLMSVVRVGTWWFFKTDQVSLAETIPSFLLGFRYDARIVCVFSAVILIIGSIPFLHPFKSATNKKGWIFFGGLFSAILIILYVFDFLHLRYLSQRLNASALSFLKDAKISSTMVWQTYPVIRILIGIILGMIVLYLGGFIFL